MENKKVLFIYPELGAESLAIEYLSSSLKQRGHDTDLIIEYMDEEYFNKRLDARINKFKPDFVAFSVVTDNYKWACRVASYVKDKFKCKIIFGGLQITSCPEEVTLNYFLDYAVLGEGDEAIIEIVENSDKEDIKNVWLRKGDKIIKNPLRDLLVDLDKLQMPDKDLFYKEAPYRQDKYYCIVGKGCPFSCTYCFNSYMRKLYRGQKWVRRRSVKSVIDELVYAKEKYKPSTVYFADDCLTSNKEWLKEFIKEYKEKINLKFTGQSHSHFLDKDTCRLLKEAGCIKIQMGVQSCIEEKRRTICNRPDTNESIKKAVNNLKEVGIIVQLDHIFELPSEKIEDYQQGLNFYIDLKPDSFVCFTLQYYPNTEIVNIGKKYGLITDEDIKQIEKGNKYPNIEIKNKELRAIKSFIPWIPLLPRKISRLIVSKKLYYLFKERYSQLPFYIKYLTTPKLFTGFPTTIRRKYLRYLKFKTKG